MQDEVEVKARELLANAPVTRFIGHDFVPKAVAIRAIAAAIRQRPVPVDLEQFRAMLGAGEPGPFVRDKDRWRSERDRLLSIIDNSRQRPVVDDARMARALEWVREATEGDAERAEHLPAIEEAIAAYDPNCGGLTVRVVDDAMVEAVWIALDPSDVPGLTRRKLRAALLAAYQQDNGGK